MMTGQQIKAKWDKDRTEAANRGTWLHLQAELFINKVEAHLTDPDMVLFLRFMKSMHGYAAYRTEWEIFDEDLMIAGSVDLVAKAPCGGYVIIDWKRTADLASKVSTRNKEPRVLDMSVLPPTVWCTMSTCGKGMVQGLTNFLGAQKMSVGFPHGTVGLPAMPILAIGSIRCGKSPAW